MLNLKEIVSLDTNGFEHLKSAELVEMYNTLSSPLNLNPVKKFKDKATAVSRTITAIDAYKASFPYASKTAEPKSEAKSFENEEYFTGDNTPKHAESAMGILYTLVGLKGINTYKALAAEFIKLYTPIYKGVKDVDMSFARGYIKGALRADHLTIKK